MLDWKIDAFIIMKWPLSTKKYPQPKSWELCFIPWEFLGLQAQEAASQVTLRELLWGSNGGVGYIGVLQQRSGSRNKRLLLIKEN